MKKVILIIFAFLVGALVGARGLILWKEIIGPPKRDTEFVRACGELNGQALTYDTIKNLNGTSYVSCGKECVTVRSFQESHVRDYQTFLSSCGTELPKIEAIPIGSSTPCKDCDYSPYACIDQYYKNVKEGQLSINIDGAFSISQGQLDGNWVCRIKSSKSSIKAVPNFMYD